MYRGRYALGQEIPLGCLCVNKLGTATMPSNVVRMNIFNAAGAKVLSKEISPLDRYGTTGLFQTLLFLDSVFAAGLYTVIYHYLLPNGFKGLETDNFEIVAGGNASGAVIALYIYEKPHARLVVQHLDSGAVRADRNPSLDSIATVTTVADLATGRNRK